MTKQTHRERPAVAAVSEQTYRERPPVAAVPEQTQRERPAVAEQVYRERPAVAEQTYRERPPAASVASEASSVWVQSVAPGSSPHQHRTIPHGSVELLCFIGGIPQIVGPQTEPRLQTLQPGSTVVGVRLRLGNAPSVLGVPASELVDLEIGADELWGEAAVRLGELIAAAASPEDATVRLEQAVFGLAAEARRPDPVVTEVADRLLPGGTDDVASLHSELFISERQLRRRVQAGIGLAPKVVQRMLRFQGFLALAHGREGDPAELAMLAAEAGYADQSHLTRESVRLAGLSPAALMRESLENCRAAGHDHAVSYEPLLLRLP
jgi:AraC-like DNA-binding protein